MTDSQLPDSTTDEYEAFQPIVKKDRRRRRRSWQSRLRRRLKKIKWPYVFLFIAALIGLLVVGVLVITTDAQNRVDTSWQSLERVLHTVSTTKGTELTLMDFERLRSSLHEMDDALARANRQTRLLRSTSGLNANIALAFSVLDATGALVDATQNILVGVEPTLFFLAGGDEEESVTIQVSSGARLVELLELGRGEFLMAQTHIASSQAYLANISLESVSPAMLLIVRDLENFLGQLQQINQMFLEAPALLTAALGLEGTQNYLVLSQNSDELRPSGGYISTYGWLQVRNGRIFDYDYKPTTATSPNPPDNILASEVALPEWWFNYGEPIYAAWDGSWYADFPSTAAMAAWYYDMGDNPHAPVDGVIAIDTVGFEYLMEALGSVVVPGYDVFVTPENFRNVIYEIRAEGVAARTPEAEHKEFVAALYKQILDDWQNVDREQGAALFGALLRSAQEKHIMLYFDDADLQRLVNTIGLAGAQLPALTHDYLMVADANFGSKSNRSVARQLIYDVVVEPSGQLDSRLTVAYDFPANVAEADPAVSPEHYVDIDYHNLMQVFVPLGSMLTDWDNLNREPVVASEDSHTIFVSSTEVEYNTGERFQFSYTSPPRHELVEAFGPYKRYRLAIQKQPGTLIESVTVQVSLPEGASVISTSPEPVATYSFEYPILEFRLDLLGDQWVEVIYEE